MLVFNAFLDFNCCSCAKCLKSMQLMTHTMQSFTNSGTRCGEMTYGVDIVLQLVYTHIYNKKQNKHARANVGVTVPVGVDAV